MIREFRVYLSAHGLRRTLARSLVELGRAAEPDDAAASRLRTRPDLTSPVHVLSLFREAARGLADPQVLELGSRAVTTQSLHDMLGLAGPHRYTGLDIHEGPNVDVVGDAHRLGALFPGASFDIVMSKSVFEHLAMPWKVVLEINAVLRTRGLLFIHTHHTFPLHDVPSDFWRYSAESWKALLNPATGFEILQTGMEFPCTVRHCVPGAASLPEHQEAYLNSTVLARKTGPYDRERLRWDASTVDITDRCYPTVLFDNGNDGEVSGFPTAPATFTLSRPARITLIRTTHWNGGAGEKPGTIWLRGANANYGPWLAAGKREGPTRNAHWIVRPDAAFPAGEYTVGDSSPGTWSQNRRSGGAGIARVEGYHVT